MNAARNFRDVSYRPAPESKTQFSMRVPKSLFSDLDACVRLWRLQAVARGDDPTNIDRTHVAVSLMQMAVAGEFAAYGGRPADAEAWKAIEAAIEEGVAQVRQARAK